MYMKNILHWIYLSSKISCHASCHQFTRLIYIKLVLFLIKRKNIHIFLLHFLVSLFFYSFSQSQSKTFFYINTIMNLDIEPRNGRAKSKRFQKSINGSNCYCTFKPWGKRDILRRPYLKPQLYIIYTKQIL